MPPIPDDKIDEVRQSTDIVDLISRYLPLKRSGNTFKANCPFHQEKTPSFHVWPETQTFKCFGCGKGGSVFHFLMERERLTFPEAVRSLAREAGIEIEEPAPGAASSKESREALFRVLDWTCRFFEAALRSPAGEKAVEYCRRRRIEGETAKQFRIGYAPPGWRNLLDAAKARGIPEDLLDRAGLVRPGRHEPYDWFRDRLVFPIEDVRGRVIGFGARALDDSEPKYLNSPDTALFKKGRTLYALHHARDTAIREKRLAIMEGYTDVVMAHQNGIGWAVAGLGTGLTREHAALAKRYAERIDLIYDADTAGQRAAERALDVFLQQEADVRVVELPDGLDPCDFLVERGRDAFLAAVAEGREVFEFLVRRARARHDLTTLSGRTAAVDEMLASVAKTTNEVARDMLLRRVAEAFEVAEASVRDRLKLFKSRPEAIETGPAYVPEEPVSDNPLERMVAEAVLFDGDLASKLAEEWPPERFRHPVYRAIATAASALAGETWEPGAVAGRLEDPVAAERAAEMLSGGRGRKDLPRQFADCVGRLRSVALLEETRQALDEARARGDDEECGRLERELFRLRSQVR